LRTRLRAHPFFTLAGIVLIIAIAATTFFVDGLQWSVPAFSVFLVLISLLYLRVRQQKTSERQRNA
jgi:L-asparagine transporter-like permease